MSAPRATSAGLSPSDHLRLAGDVRFRIVVEEGVVLRQQSAEVLIVNEVGARVLDLVDPQTTIRGITDRLEEEFEVERPELERDVVAFLGELLAAGVVESVAAEPE